jgi:hypothetical protein
MNDENIYQPGAYKFVQPATIHLVNRHGVHRIVRMGFCWPGFLVPVLWAMSEGLWRPFAFSLIFFFADRVAEAVALSCEQGAACSAVPYAAVFRLTGFVSYVFMMGYLGYNGKNLLVTDLQRHGYFVEGSPPPAEPDQEQP